MDPVESVQIVKPSAWHLWGAKLIKRKAMFVTSEPESRGALSDFRLDGQALLALVSVAVLKDFATNRTHFEVTGPAPFKSARNPLLFWRPRCNHCFFMGGGLLLDL